MITKSHLDCPECSINPFVKELVGFLGEKFSHEKMHYAAINLANKWNEKERYGEEILEFYLGAEDYLYDLVSWHGSDPNRRKWTETIRDYVLEKKCGVVMDFGCGIGNDGLALADIKIPVIEFVDVPCPCLNFLKYRLKIRKMGHKIIESNGDIYVPMKFYDLIICLDVIEHLNDVEGMLDNLLKCTKSIAMTVQGTDQWHPMHLEKNAKFTDQGVMNELLAKYKFKRVQNDVLPIYERESW